MRKAIVLYIALMLMLTITPLISNNIYAPEAKTVKGINETNNETKPPINDTPLPTTINPLNLTNTNPSDPYSTLTTCGGRFRFYRRNVNDKLVEFTDNEGYKISFAPNYPIGGYTITDNIKFKASYPNFTTEYEAISNIKVKNTIVINSHPGHNIINETLNYDDNKLDYYLSNGEIIFIEKKQPNQLINTVPKFKVEKPYAVDSNDTYGYCYYGIQENTLNLIIDQDFLNNATYPVFVDPTWIDNTTNSWDNGTKQDGLDGNYMVCTSSDNNRTQTNTLQLENKLSDKFSKPYNSTTSWKQSIGDLGADSGTVGGDINITHAGEYYLYAGSPSAIGQLYRGTNNIINIANPFDVTAHLKIKSGWSVYSQASIYVHVDSNNYMSINRIYTTASPINRINAYIKQGGAIKAGPSDTANTLTDLYLRLSNDGTTYYCQYKENPGDSWNTLISWAGVISGTADITTQTRSATNNHKLETTWDDLTIASGTITGIQYRTYGNFTSENLTLPSGATINNWTLNLTGGDLNNYVNISFLQGESEERARYDNITSNITITLDMCPNLAKVKPEPFRYKLEFVGNGSSSPIVHASYGFLNYKPIPVVADDDIHAEVNDLVILDGNSSYDPDGSIINFTWGVLINGSVTYFYGAIVNYTFTEAGTYLFELIVRDNNNASAHSSDGLITITAPSPPAAPPTIDEAVTSGVGTAFLVLLIIIAAMWFINKARAIL